MSGGTNECQRSLDASSGSLHLKLPGRLPTVQELELLTSRSGQQSPRRLMTSIWTMQSRLELWALPRTVPYARRRARQVLGEWGLDKLSETVELLVSEIITNAVHASAGPAGRRHGEATANEASTLLFWLAADGERALIQVWDCCEAKPQRRELAISAESSRGLLLVEALSDEWGSYVPSGWAGKVVWALVAGE
jgi:anti-sigma regulatory factor (Ser/Thr protein kinase)